METQAEGELDGQEHEHERTNPEDVAAAQVNLLPIAVAAVSGASSRRFIRKCTIDGGSKKVNLTAHL